MPIPPRCSITEFVNSNCTAFVASFQRTSALSFTDPSPHPFPLPLRRSLFCIVFYCNKLFVRLRQEKLYFKHRAEQVKRALKNRITRLQNTMASLRFVFFLIRRYIFKKQSTFFLVYKASSKHDESGDNSIQLYRVMT